MLSYESRRTGWLSQHRLEIMHKCSRARISMHAIPIASRPADVMKTVVLVAVTTARKD
jgi:hypothetical protein